MNAWNWALAVFALLALVVDAPAQQPQPYSYSQSVMAQGSPWAQVSYPQPLAPNPDAPHAMSSSRVVDNPPAGEVQIPYVTAQQPTIRTAYESPWSTWTTQVDPEPTMAPSPYCPPGPGCADACAGDTISSRRGMFYFRAEALALRRSHPPGRPVAFDINTGAVVLDARGLNFPIALGQRFVAGYEINESSAVEAVFFENQNWKSSQLASGTNSLFLSGDPATTISNLSANSNDYLGASNMSLIDHTSLRNFELNFLQATTFSKFTVLAGYRYVDVHDKLDLSSTFVDNFGNRSTSNYMIDARNRLHGGQLGLVFRQTWDLFTFELIGKSGIYDNFAAQSQVVGDQNNTTTLRNTARQLKQDLAFVGDVGMNGIIQLNGNLLFRFGYNVLWIDHVALAPNQLDFTDTSTSGLGVINKHGNLFMHGVSTGLEARW